MNIIIDQPKLVRVVKLYLTKNFSGLKPKRNPKNSDSVLYVNSDNQILMEHNKKKKRVWVGYGEIWSKLESYFKLDFKDIQLIMKVWLEERYNLSESHLKQVFCILNFS